VLKGEIKALSTKKIIIMVCVLKREIKALAKKKEIY
jgi:hypothetical protein